MIVHGTFTSEVAPPAKPTAGLFLANVRQVSGCRGLEQEGAVMCLCDVYQPAGVFEAERLVFLGLGGRGGREARFSRALRNWSVEMAFLKTFARRSCRRK